MVVAWQHLKRTAQITVVSWGRNDGKHGENMVETLEKMEKTMEHPGKNGENDGENM